MQIEWARAKIFALIYHNHIMNECWKAHEDILQLYLFYYRTKSNSMFGHFVSKTAQKHTLTPLFKNSSKLCSEMDLHQLWERSDQVLNLVLFDSKENIAVSLWRNLWKHYCKHQSQLLADEIKPVSWKFLLLWKILSDTIFLKIFKCYWWNLRVVNVHL